MSDLRNDDEYYDTLNSKEQYEWQRCMTLEDKIIFIFEKHGFNHFEALTIIDYLDEQFKETLKVINEM